MKRKHENIAWSAVWGLVFILIPLTMLRQLASGQDEGALRHIFSIWAGILPFFILFLIHHLFILPVFRNNIRLYAGLTVALLAVFSVFCFSRRMPDGPPPFPEMQAVPGREYAPAPPQGMGGPPPRPEGDRAPLRPDVMNLLMGILLIGVDLGVFSYVESVRKERRIKELQGESLSQQLETLRYQINPHFFMNTLNNIHALVDIDPEKAKESIEEFSKMMRILLYEGNSPTIPLGREIDFIEHYLSLMRLRYPEDTVRITQNFPEDRSGALVPPLLMASFVENAFKHGISYESESFINVSCEIKDGKLFFHCANSHHPAASGESHGLGLENIRKRLDLLYGSDYTLYTGGIDKAYDVVLAIPPKPKTLNV